MIQVLKVLASCRSEETSAAIKQALADAKDIRVDYRNGAIADIMQEFQTGRRIDLMILDVDLAADSELQQLTELIGAAPERMPIIATGANASVERIRLLMRLGLADFVPQPIAQQDLISSLQLARRKAAHAADARSHGGAVIAVARAVGGMGASTFAVNAANALANDERHPRKVCLIDLDIQHGLSSLYLDISSPVGVTDCTVDPRKLDASLLHSVATHHNAGFDVLSAPEGIAAIDEVTTEGLRVLFDIARDEYDVLIVDMPPSWVDWWDAVIEATDCMVIVTQMTIAALRRTRDMIDALKGAGYGDVPLHIVCNRFEKKLFAKGLHLKDAERALGRKVNSWIPADFMLVSTAENEGVPIAQHKRGSKVEKAIARIAVEALQRIEKERAQTTAQLGAG